MASPKTEADSQATTQQWLSQNKIQLIFHHHNYSINFIFSFNHSYLHLHITTLTTVTKPCAMEECPYFLTWYDIDPYEYHWFFSTRFPVFHSYSSACYVCMQPNVFRGMLFVVLQYLGCGGLGVCSMPCNWKVAGSNPPHANA